MKLWSYCSVQSLHRFWPVFEADQILYIIWSYRCMQLVHNVMRRAVVKSPSRGTDVAGMHRTVRRNDACFSKRQPLTLWSPEAIIVPHRIIWSWHTGRWWVGYYIWYSEEGTGRGCSPPRPLLTVPNVTAHPSTASIPITVYNGPLLCSFNMSIMG